MCDSDRRPQWNLYALDKPQQIIAAVLDGEEVYFDCGECGAEDAIMFGYMATSPRREDVAFDPNTNRPAFFCKKCWAFYTNTEER